MTLIQCRQLSKNYDDGKNALTILNEIDFSVNEKEALAIVGASGSGKSTFLHLLAGLDEPTSGDVIFQNQNWKQFSETQRAGIRSRTLGFVYQFHHLLMDFTAIENVTMPLLIQGKSRSESLEKAALVLKQVGLDNRFRHRMSELSGGERQRVAIARAMVTQPKCILADEPTGNLDEENAKRILDLFFELQENIGMSLVLVTHDMNIAKRAGRVLTLHQGKLTESSLIF